jgi:hypothetical protein
MNALEIRYVADFQKIVEVGREQMTIEYELQFRDGFSTTLTRIAGCLKRAAARSVIVRTDNATVDPGDEHYSPAVGSDASPWSGERNSVSAI